MDKQYLCVACALVLIGGAFASPKLLDKAAQPIIRSFASFWGAHPGLRLFLPKVLWRMCLLAFVKAITFTLSNLGADAFEIKSVVGGLKKRATETSNPVFKELKELITALWGAIGLIACAIYAYMTWTSWLWRAGAAVFGILFFTMVMAVIVIWFTQLLGIARRYRSLRKREDAQGWAATLILAIVLTYQEALDAHAIEPASDATSADIDNGKANCTVSAVQPLPQGPGT